LTEAFSPEDEMFAKQRLQQALKLAGTSSVGRTGALEASVTSSWILYRLRTI